MRALSGQDAATMAELHARSFPKGWSVDDMRAHIQKDLCVGMGEPLAAFIIVSCAGEQADIITLAVEPDHRRQGLGASLLAAAEKNLCARGAQVLFLEVAEDNLAAQALYRAAGYQPIGRRPAYYRRDTGRVAALTFSKRLSNQP